MMACFYNYILERKLHIAACMPKTTLDETKILRFKIAC